MKSWFCIVLILLLSTLRVACQETVFALLKNDLKLADQYFEKKNYRQALELYLHVVRKNPSKDVEIKIARSYHFLKDYNQAVKVYKKHAASLTVPDLYYYAESQSGISDYQKAAESYQNYLNRVPDDPFILKKIWRLNNIQFLFEDSSHYAIRSIPLNSEYGDLCAVPYRDGIVFMSNRKEVQPVEKLNASANAPFYKLYFSRAYKDSVHFEMFQYDAPAIFNRTGHSGFHAGPLSFYDHGQKMVFASTAAKIGQKGGRTLALYFAEQKGGDWETTGAFPYNSEHYAISDPSMNEDGTVLYFSSDMNGGFGGKDLYKSEWTNNQWSNPVNLGDIVNTPYDEVFPFLNKSTLYFSSNGHAGLGGLDIFKMEIKDNDFNEPENMGFPLNTNYDDFGIVIDSTDTHGYFSSNRNRGGYNDDIYEFEMDLQTYPLLIEGVLKFKAYSWSDSLELKAMPHAKIFLIDNIRNVIVHESECDAHGNFTIHIPYYSKYKLKVIGEDNDENIVSLEIPKQKRSQHRHEIVVVKDAFKSN